MSNEFIPIESKMLKEAKYDPITLTLTVRFKTNNSLYELYDVPKFVFEAMLAAESCGSYYHNHLKHKYRTQRIE